MSSNSILQPSPTFTRILVDNKEAAEDLSASIRQAGVVAFDTETRSIDFAKYPDGALLKMTMRIDLASFALPNRTSYVVPLGMVTLDNLPLDMFIETLQPVMEDPSILKKAWNYPFDAGAYANTGIDVFPFEDDMIKAHLLDENRSVSLKERCKDINMELNKFDFKTYWKARHAFLTGQTDKKGALKITRTALHDMEKAYLGYSTEDAEATILWDEFGDAELAKPENAKLKDLFHRLLNPTARVLFHMERRGIPVDRTYMATIRRTCHAEMSKAEALVYSSIGRHFNLGSTKELSKVLYQDLNLPVTKVTDKGAPSTDYAALANLAQRGYKVAEHILRWRGYQKLYSAYLAEDGGFAEATYEWGSIHPSFNICGTTSGRLSQCVAANTVLDTSKGKCRISDLKVDQETPVTIITHEGRPRRILNVIKKPRAQMYRVKTTDGRTIDCTMDHRFLVRPAGEREAVWKALRDIAPGDRLVCPAEVPSDA